MRWGVSLTVAIPAKNEETYIGRCIESVQGLADEILVVVDPDSQDRTEAICREAGVRIETVAFVSFSNLRNETLDLCRHPWVFFLDADEVATPELRQEIAGVIERRPDPDDLNAVVGYWIPRHNYFFGRRVGHAGWYPDYQLRLLWRARARYPEDQRVHEVVQLRGRAEKLETHFLHYNIDTLYEFRMKQRRYAHLEAEMLLEQGHRARPRHLISHPLREFFRRYVTLSGWRDGPLGLFLCAAMAYYTFHTYRHLRGMQAANRKERDLTKKKQE
jgi:glycosyltransferase involved in cell wall biosynthesis